MILDILQDEQYIGTYTAGKTRMADIGSGKVVKVDKADWIRIPNHHPTIIDPALFEAVKIRIGTKGEPLRKRKLGTSERYKDMRSVLQGRVFCGCCGHKMKLSATRNAAFHCDVTRVASDAECYRLKMLGGELEKAVLGCVKKHARYIIKSAGDGSNQSEPSAGFDTQFRQIEKKKLALYERYVLREISAEEYKAAKSGLDAEFERMKNAHAILSKEAEKSASVEGFRQIADDSIKAKTLTQPIVDELIDKVKVSTGGRIEIVWKMQHFGSAVLQGSMQTFE